jgi:uncharacterized membrane protein YdfJ with MMPL/SSD domain
VVPAEAGETRVPTVYAVGRFAVRFRWAVVVAWVAAAVLANLFLPSLASVAVFAVVEAGQPGGAVYRDILASLAVGILMDAFAVRTLLVPATVALLGRWNWWPSARGRRPALAGAPAQVTRPSAAFTPEG